MSRKKRSDLAEPLKTSDLMWKVHTPNLLKEIMINPELWALKQPVLILSNILQELTKHAITLDDPKLNLIMARLTLYDQADPEGDCHIPGLVEQLAEIVEQNQQSIPAS